MSDKDINQEDKGEELTPEEIDTLRKRVAELEGGMNNLVEEVKTVRSKKQEAEAERDALLKKLEGATGKPEGTPNESTDVKATVEAVLAEKDREVAKSNAETAIAKFKSSHKEFHESNDPSGLKLAAVKAQVSRFNTEGLKTVEEHLAVYEDALRLMNRDIGSQDQGTDFNPYAATPSNSGNDPDVSKAELTAKERKLIGMQGWTEEKYLAHKAKRPDYVQSLLDNMS